MKLIYMAMLALAAFIAIWFFVVVPSERKHHERKLRALRTRIERREGQQQDNSSTPQDDEPGKQE